MVSHRQGQFKKGDEESIIRASTASGHNVSNGKGHFIILIGDIGLAYFSAGVNVVLLEASSSLSTVPRRVGTELLTEIGNSGNAIIREVNMKGGLEGERDMG